jgi:hypothetical protein
MRRCLLLVLCAVPCAPVMADVVPPPPKECPPGHVPSTSHQGTFCQPPPPKDCPPGHVPRVARTLAYCEPPPPVPCPAGAFWVSRGPEVGNGYCTSYVAETCPDDRIAVESSLCVYYGSGHRGRRYEIISGPCRSTRDCQDSESCTKARRCVTREQLKASKARPRKARNINPELRAPQGAKPKPPASARKPRRP